MGYWRAYSERRLSRRRAIVGGGLAAGSALFLMACGGSSEEKAGSAGEGLLSKAPDTTSKATRGGIWASSTPADTPSFDPMGSSTVRSVTEGNFVYSRLLKYKVGTRDERPNGDVEGDAATSWEVSPDRQQITFKLRPGMKFDARQPTNGRALNSQDVLWSWNKFLKVSTSRGQLANEVDPGAPITSLTAPDPQTVVVKLAFPMAPILQLLAYHWYLVVEPVEAEDKFDPKGDMRGSGPWILDKYTPSVTFQYRRNPDYYVKDRPFLDGIDQPIITEYASALAQFEAGKIWNFDVRQDDILRVKRSHPSMNLLVGEAFSRGNPQVLGLSGLSSSPLRDARLRQAISMLVDRDSIIELNSSPSIFRKEGIDVETRWHSHISCGEEGMWLDPKAKEMGEGSKYFEFSVSEAAKLVKAASREGTEIPFTYFPTTLYSNQWPKQAEVLMDMLQQGGLKVKANVVDYATEYAPRYLGGGANFEGMAMLPGKAEADIDGQLASKFLPSGRNSYIKEALPEINDMILAQRKEFDRDKRFTLVKDIQKKLAVQMPAVPLGGLSLGFTVGWPWMGNRGAIVGWAGANGYELNVHYWLDKAKQQA